MTHDHREDALNNAARIALGDDNPHFSSIEENIVLGTRLFLARYDALKRIGPSTDRAFKATAEWHDQQVANWTTIYEEAQGIFAINRAKHILQSHVTSAAYFRSLISK